MDIFRHVVKNKWQEVIKATIQQISSLLNLLRMIVNKNAKTFSGILFLFKRVTIKIPISTWIKKKIKGKGGGGEYGWVYNVYIIL